MLVGEMRYLNVITNSGNGLINISNDRIDVSPDSCNTVALYPSQVSPLAERLYAAKRELDDKPLREIKISTFG